MRVCVFVGYRHSWKDKARGRLTWPWAYADGSHRLFLFFWLILMLSHPSNLIFHYPCNPYFIDSVRWSECSYCPGWERQDWTGCLLLCTVLAFTVLRMVCKLGLGPEAWGIQITPTFALWPGLLQLFKKQKRYNDIICQFIFKGMNNPHENILYHVWYLFWSWSLWRWLYGECHKVVSCSPNK